MFFPSIYRNFCVKTSLNKFWPPQDSALRTITTEIPNVYILHTTYDNIRQRAFPPLLILLYYYIVKYSCHVHSFFSTPPRKVSMRLYNVVVAAAKGIKIKK